ncbi:MAG: WbqC family protein [Lewinellaceae bacterium]|nr:WbqC family protein [Lewinellaceae bacterium]
MQSLLELPYWPPVSWLAIAWHSDVLWLEACEHYQKGSYRNRCHIAGPNGLQRLSIPLEKGKHQQTPIRDVRISYSEPWQKQHWRSITTAYGNAPFFEHLEGRLARFYEKPIAFLFDLNLELLEFALSWLDAESEIKLTTQYLEQVQTPLTDWRNQVIPKATTPPDWFQAQSYPQVFLERHGFLPDLSALDLLFCCGKQSKLILQQSFLQH